MGGQWHRTSRRIHILYGKGNENDELGTGFFVHKRISAVKRVEFVSDRMSYIILRGCWFRIIVLNVHAPTENLHEIINDNGVRVINFATSKDHTFKSTMFPHCNIHKYTWKSPDGKIHNQMTIF
jgi:hypothetical protein